MAKKRIKKQFLKQNKKSLKRKIIPKITKIKSEKLYNSICRIYDEKNKKIGTGFFMQITLENIPYFFLLTCNNIITNEQIENHETIVLYILTNGEEEERKIKIEKRSFFIFYENFNTTLLEILDSDNISKERFLYPDLNYRKGYNFYLNKNFYMAGFENNNNKNNKFISSFKMESIRSFEFLHNINKGQEASGSLICTKSNLNIIGINGGNPLQSGHFIGKIVDILENERKGIIENNNISLYKGSFMYGLKHGKGEGYFIDGGLYEGDWINDRREGKGTMYYSNGNIYIGEWINNRREGKGLFYFWKGGSYEGEFKNDIIDGYGKFKAGNGYNEFEIEGTFKIWSLDNPNFDAFNFINQYNE
jgi:hypothetical protein